MQLPIPFFHCLFNSSFESTVQTKEEKTLECDGKQKKGNKLHHPKFAIVVTSQYKSDRETFSWTIQSDFVCPDISKTDKIKKINCNSYNITVIQAQ